SHATDHEIHLTDLHLFLGDLFHVRERLPDEDLAHLPVLHEHREEERSQDGCPRQRVDAHLPVHLGTNGVVHLGDHALHTEDLLRDLRGHEVAVVALGQSEDGVGLLDPGLPEHLEVGPVAEDRLALERRRQVLEPRSFGTGRAYRRDIDDADVVSLGVKETRQEPTHTAATDDDNVHAF